MYVLLNFSISIEAWLLHVLVFFILELQNVCA